MANPMSESLDLDSTGVQGGPYEVPQYSMVNDAGNGAGEEESWAPRPRKSRGPAMGGVFDALPAELPCTSCGVEDQRRLCLNLTLIWFIAGISFILGVVAVSKVNASSSSPSVVTFSECRSPTDMRLFGEDVTGNPDNGHHYQIVGGSYAEITWHQAYSDARQRCYDGSPGYLAHIDSQEENDFLVDLAKKHATLAGIAAHGWIGATDVASEGQFQWVSGESALFWTARGLVDGKYANWAPGEPNGVTGGEDCVMMMTGDGELNSMWSDEACYSLKEFFIVEYDG